MTIGITSFSLSVLVLTVVLLGAVLLARPWQSSRSGSSDGPGRVGLRDRWRIGFAVLRYDFWLEVRGMGRRRRRGLREELRANLEDAAARVGATEAVAALGSLRRMAADAATESGSGPRWSTGSQIAGFVLLFGFLAELFAVITWVSGAEAAGVDRVEGGLPLFPGSAVIWEHTPEKYGVELQPGWLVIAATVLAFVVASRPWTIGRRKVRSRA